ncbi:hypothetical protein BRAO285_1170003 [Bradyrhizobium sp. ORS 285]|nr:hypothetical protein BRAO285_1170003 [Bradyrhizobium sp. ORS 285]
MEDPRQRESAFAIADALRLLLAVN